MNLMDTPSDVVKSCVEYMTGVYAGHHPWFDADGNTIPYDTALFTDIGDVLAEADEEVTSIEADQSQFSEDNLVDAATSGQMFVLDEINEIQ